MSGSSLDGIDPATDTGLGIPPELCLHVSIELFYYLGLPLFLLLYLVRVEEPSVPLRFLFGLADQWQIYEQTHFGL